MKTNNVDYPYLMTDKDGFMLQCDDLPYFQPYPRRTRNIFILFCISGSADIMKDLKTYTLQTNMAWIIMFDNIIQVKNASSDFKVRYCFFSPNLFDEVTFRMESVFFDFLSNDVPFLHHNIEDTYFITHIFDLIQIIYDDKDNMYRRRIAVNTLQSFFFDLYNKVHKIINNNGKSDYNNKDNLMKEFFKLISQYYKINRNVSFYADKLCISSRYLSMVTNAAGGNSPKEIINNYITLEIKIQLQSTNYTIQEIAERLNFSDQAVMGRFFKQQTGLSAMEYRKGSFNKKK